MLSPYKVPTPWFAINEAEPMPQDQIHADYLKSVAFLFVKERGTGAKKYGGTAFFVEIRLPDNIGWVCYLITCNHLLVEAKAKGPLFVRINSSNGTTTEHLIPYTHWARFEQGDLAVAKVEFALPHEVYNPIILKWFVAQQEFIDDSTRVIPTPSFGIGTKVFYAGLFSKFELTSRNYPVARFASIALMQPVDKIPLGDELIDGYLIETHSWGGFSGSPVFLYPTIHFPGSSPWEDKALSQYTGAFLGVLHGHYGIEEEVKVGGKPTTAKVDLNSGLAVVSTAQQLYDFLMCEEFVMNRKKMADDIREQRPRPILDTSLVARSVIEAAIGEPLTGTKKATKKAKKHSKRTSR